jgi:hypothetical protein
MRPTCVVSSRWDPGSSLISILQYAQPVTKKGAKAAAAAEEKKEGEEKKLSRHVQRNLAERRKGEHRVFCPVLVTGVYLTNCRWSDAKIDNLLEAQFGAGRLYAAISSRPGQVGRSDGYILEGKELEVGFKFGCGRFGLILKILMIHGDLVLLEEIADRETEACVVVHGANGLFLSVDVTPVGCLGHRKDGCFPRPRGMPKCCPYNSTLTTLENVIVKFCQIFCSRSPVFALKGGKDEEKRMM